MNIKGKAGSKQRLFEMMQGVNKTNLNENYWKDELFNILKQGIDILKSNSLKNYSSNLQTIDEVSYIGINGYDSEGNMYNFNFKINAVEGDQEGVGKIQDVVLENFYFKNKNGETVFDVNEDDLIEFNKQYGSELYDIIEKYIDGGEIAQDKSDEELDETIENKEDSQPYGGSKEKYQDGSGYVDEKPVNSKTRTKSSNIGTYVKEDDEENQSYNWGEDGKFKDFDGIMKFVKNDELDENEDEDDGENILKRVYLKLLRDLDFRKLVTAYENIFKLKNSELRQSEIINKTLANLRDSIVNYLQKIKGLNISDMDVQNFFENRLNKFSSLINEDNEDNEDNEVPALDVDDVDNDGDKLEGGLGDNADVMQYDPQEVLKGIEVEMEHTKDPKIALEITMDHLEELPDYYTRLEKMEKRGKEDLNNNEFDDESSEKDLSIDINDLESDEELPNELAGHVNDIKNADQELENTLLGFSNNTPNTTVEDYDFAAQEREYEDKKAYDRFQELDSKPYESLSDEEKVEYYELWQNFGDV